MSDILCSIHLIKLKAGFSARSVLQRIIPPVAAGIAHDWVIPPVQLDHDDLTRHAWDFFLLSEQHGFSDFASHRIEDRVSVKVRVPKAQYDALAAKRDAKAAAPGLPVLPEGWIGIPPSAILSDQPNAGPGTLRFDKAMAAKLSSALPPKHANKPVSLFNLFKYKNGDRSTHDAYMEDFKRGFGNSAGAAVKFMGPVDGSLARTQGSARLSKQSESRWDDANLVQYDTIWHYAYMLSTELYERLNKQKVAGLDDTCILIVSEAELGAYNEPLTEQEKALEQQEMEDYPEAFGKEEGGK